MHMPITLNEEKIPERSARDIYYVLFRHKWKIIFFFFAVVITVTVGTLLAPEIYRSDAKILVRVGRESVSLDPTATSGTVMSLGQQREYEIKSELEILNSRDLIEKVVDAIGPSALLKYPEEINEEGRSPSEASQNIIREIRQKLRVTPVPNRAGDRDKAVLNIMEGIKIEDLKNSNIITISFQAKSRKVAQEVINKLIGFYLDKHINVHRTRGSYEFFNEQTDQLRNTLAKAEENLRDLKNKTGIASLDEQRHSLVTRIGDLQRELLGTESTLAASSAKVKEMRKTLSGIPETRVIQETSGTANTAADSMRAKFYELQLKKQELLSKYTENNKQVQDITGQIAEAQALLDKEEPTRTQTTRGQNEAHKQVQVALLAEEATLSSLQAKSKEQRAQLKSAREELKAINDSEIRLTQVHREMAIKEEDYRKYYVKLEQARMDQALEVEKISNISVVQPATYPIKPVRSKRLLYIALGLFLGIFGGIGLAFTTEYLDHTFKKPEDIEERLKLPTLAAIPCSGRNRKLITHS